MSGSRWWVLVLGVAMAIAGCVSVSTTETDADASALPKSSLSPSPTSEGAEKAIFILDGARNQRGLDAIILCARQRDVRAESAFLFIEAETFHPRVEVFG